MPWSWEAATAACGPGIRAATAAGFVGSIPRAIRLIGGISDIPQPAQAAVTAAGATEAAGSMVQRVTAGSDSVEGLATAIAASADIDPAGGVQLDSVGGDIETIDRAQSGRRVGQRCAARESKVTEIQVGGTSRRLIDEKVLSADPGRQGSLASRAADDELPRRTGCLEKHRSGSPLRLGYGR